MNNRKQQDQTSVISVSSAVKKRRSRLVEKITFWIFRLTTYFVIACAGYIFLDIAIKGGRTVFKSTAPFINVDFLTQPPQTLYVFDYEGKKWTLSDREFRSWKTAHPGVEVEANSIAYSAGGIWPCIVGTAMSARREPAVKTLSRSLIGKNETQ